MTNKSDETFKGIVPINEETSSRSFKDFNKTEENR